MTRITHLSGRIELKSRGVVAFINPFGNRYLRHSLVSFPEKTPLSLLPCHGAGQTSGRLSARRRIISPL